MSSKRFPLVVDNIYHIVNRGVASSPIFNNRWDYKALFERMLFYRHVNPPLRYSYFINLPVERKIEAIAGLEKDKNFLVDIICYCFMPNHWHLLLKQIQNDGIMVFINRLSNSYARYFNTKHNRKGPMFQGRFKSILIEDDNQLFHTSRYIHLNPYSSKIVTSLDALETYQFSSLKEYVNKADREVCEKDIIIKSFKRTSYRSFVFDHADYQKKLEKYKHLFLE